MAYFRDIFTPYPRPKFWINTFLHLVTPGGFGYVRRLRAMKDESYVHERDKDPVRHKHHGQSGWKPEKEGGLSRRDYASYEEYLTHQKLKLDEMVKMKGGFTGFEIFDYRLKFYARFRHLLGRLPADARILCCGARQGTEVEVLRDLGFRNARGIDLNPGAGNPLVEKGDMMKLDLPDDSLDLLYTNCVDHAFDLEQLLAEHRRVLKPRGMLLYDIAFNEQEGAGIWESIEWDRSEDILERLLPLFHAVLRVERDRHWLWVLMQGKNDAPVAKPQSL